MKLSYSIDPVAHVVEFHYTGSLDFAEWSAVMEAILADPAFRQGYGFLTDRRSGAWFAWRSTWAASSRFRSRSSRMK